jgi:hypothetical protein
MTAISKTQAIKQASYAVSLPFGRGTSWSVSGPYYGIKNLRGTRTEIQTDSYWKARLYRTQWATSLTLELLGWNWSDADRAAEEFTGSVRERVNQAISN